MYTFLKYFFGLLTFGTLSETYRILMAPEYTTMRMDLLPMCIGFTLLFGYLSIRFHYKRKKEQQKLKL
ncbi:hypothetical protein [Xanthocytophaga flava]|uniref:hypothetical protein n=1 Tax=Xanthocytophaga flava TaxID=3048013 RepID=UPI0028D6E0AF|nr:hypothetical protein [Xanthocytophaga flavus]